MVVGRLSAAPDVVVFWRCKSTSSRNEVEGKCHVLIESSRLSQVVSLCIGTPRRMQHPLSIQSSFVVFHCMRMYTTARSLNSGHLQKNDVLVIHSTLETRKCTIFSDHYSVVAY